MGFERTSRAVHFTASALLFSDGRVLLVHHERLDAWVPPGGHIETGEIPSETAVREVLEETGLAVRVISAQAPPSVKFDPDTFFVPQPLFMQCVSALEKGEQVYHLDTTYLAELVENGGCLPEPVSGDGVRDCLWIPLDRLGEFQLATNVMEAVEMAVKKLDKLPGKEKLLRASGKMR